MITSIRMAVLALAGTAVLSTACSTDSPTESGAPSTSQTITTPAAPGTTGAPTSAPSDPALAGPLHEAAAADDGVRVRELLDRGAPLEARDDQGRTPLVTAVKNQATAAARVLIDAGADVDAKDDMQDSAYLYAGAEGYDEILTMTLAHGADVRSLNRYGGTALIPAAEHGFVSTVRILIEAGVDVDHVNTPRWTALQEAVIYGDGSQKYQDTVTALLDAGADPNIRDAEGRTVLENAERLGQTAIVEILRNHS
ncbi:ankyrin repeat domain-containing protein [Nocardia sp. GTS18]|uniref:ankyrin repeat domain-containing protein n=1 Tax=Nocardia sp. GTS18 TaxID=1778064 RepID=UPI003519F836